MVCLTRLAPRLSSGGRLVVDDYYAWSGCHQVGRRLLPRPRRVPPARAGEAPRGPGVGPASVRDRADAFGFSPASNEGCAGEPLIRSPTQWRSGEPPTSLVYRRPGPACRPLPRHRLIRTLARALVDEADRRTPPSLGDRQTSPVGPPPALDPSDGLAGATTGRRAGRRHPLPPTRSALGARRTSATTCRLLAAPRQPRSLHRRGVQRGRRAGRSRHRPAVPGPV